MLLYQLFSNTLTLYARFPQAGLAGEGLPKAVVPSIVGYFGDSSDAVRDKSSEGLSPSPLFSILIFIFYFIFCPLFVFFPSFPPIPLLIC